MSQFGVSDVRWSDDLSEVVECRVHTIEEGDGKTRLTGGVAYPFAGLAEVAAGGDDEVWLMVVDATGVLAKYAQMTVVQGQGGRPVMSSDDVLRELPTF